MAIQLRHMLPLVERFMAPVWWTVSLRNRLDRPPRRRDHKRVLCVAYNDLTARYVGKAAQLIGDKARRYVTRAPFADTTIPLSQILSRVDGRYVSFVSALVQWWDLLISADHYPCTLFHPNIKKVYVTHGLWTRDAYRYGNRALRRDGSPRYARMLAAGPLERECALRFNPSIENSIAVVGDPFVDELIKLDSQRDECRCCLGIRPEQTAVLIMSSWGPKSLIRTIGRRIIEEAKNFPARYRFMITIHPNNYTRSTGGMDWRGYMDQQRAAGFLVLRPDEAWQPYLVAADLAVTDFTSLGLYFAQLLRPIIFCPVNRDEFITDSPLAQVHDLSLKLVDFPNLKTAIDASVTNYPKTALRGLADRIAIKGEAHRRIPTELSQLLESD